MKKSLQIFSAALFLAGINSGAWAQNTYYWRGQTGGNWSTLSNWTMVTPGNAPLAAVPASLPTASDDVIFDNLSFNANGRTVTVDVPASAGNLNFSDITRTVTFTVNQPLTIAGSLTLSTNITAVGRAAGNTTGAIRFTSAAAATITSASVLVNVPVTFNGAGGRWTLSGDLRVNQLVTFTSGYVLASHDVLPAAANNSTLNTASISKLVFTSAATAVSTGASVNSYVMGYVQKQNASSDNISGEFVFPVGNSFEAGSQAAANYRPIGVGGLPSSPSTLTARYINADPNTNSPLDRSRILAGTFNLNSVSQYEYWYLNGRPSNGKVSLSYNRPGAENYYFFNDPWRIRNLTVAGWKPNDRRWEDISNAVQNPINTADMTVTSTGALNQIEFFTIGSRGVTPLPVRLISFTARKQENRVQLNWLTASEENSSHFEVERSSDGRNFTALTTVNAQGNSSSPVTYVEADMSPLPGTSYYRLRMVDLDGTFSCSKTVAVSSAPAGLQVRAYPNPSKGSSVHLSESTGAKLRLMGVSDMSGRAVSCQTTDAGADGLCLNFTSSLAPGFYLATLASSENGQPVRVKFTVQ
jgi:hypothetical protein